MTDARCFATAVAVSVLTLAAAAPVARAAELGAGHDSDARQTGNSWSGDANVGQITAVASSGDTSLDAANHSRDVHVRTGDAEGSNTLHRQTWTTGFTVDDDDHVFADDHDDDDDLEDDWDFNSVAITGDGVGGQIMGVVTQPGGTADLVVANTSDDVDLRSGDAVATDDSYTETGDAIGGQAGAVSSAGRTVVDATNLSRDADVRTGDGYSTYSDAFTGDGIAGQVFGVVTASTGSADVALANTSDRLDVRTGDADALWGAWARSGDGIAGQVAGVNAGGDTTVDAINASIDGDLRTGDAEAIEDDANAFTGDGVAGQVLGVVSAPGGRADLVGANTSTRFDVVTGDALMEHVDVRFIGVPDVIEVL